MHKTVACRVPATLATEIEKAAAQELMSVSTYVRRLLLLAIRNEQAGVATRAA